MRFTFGTWLITLALLGCGCSGDGGIPAESIARSTVMGLNLGFNMHSPAEMGRNVSTDVEVFYIEGHEMLADTKGRAALAKSMASYFATYAGARAEIESTQVLLPYVATLERVYWQTEDGERSQASLAVYEMAGDKVRRVWYFPAVR